MKVFAFCRGFSPIGSHCPYSAFGVLNLGARQQSNLQGKVFSWNVNLTSAAISSRRFE